MKNLNELLAVKDSTRANIDNTDISKGGNISVRVGLATCGIAAGAKSVHNAFKDEADKRNLKNVKISQVGCVGMCRLEPMVDVIIDGVKTTYIRLTPDKVAKIVAEHIVNGNVCYDYVIGKEN